ncbi:expressed conserved protein [Echinococcus multilocularis]|uniref:Expressed conserved protein n=1 Tax=Echinococcus multilocularis TaxID=6211 RepID=A0A068Y756_ECHMU|nr:expressed conserved protein [Echinococcus multilocularis]
MPYLVPHQGHHIWVCSLIWSAFECHLNSTDRSMQNRPLTRLYLPSDTCKRFQKYLQENEVQHQHRQQQQQMDSREVRSTMDTGITTASAATRRMTRRSVAELRSEMDHDAPP